MSAGNTNLMYVRLLGTRTACGEQEKKKLPNQGKKRYRLFRAFEYMPLTQEAVPYTEQGAYNIREYP